jgi:hypothetical protein
MKKVILFICAIFSTSIGFSQNLLQPSGSVGIGTLNPENGFLLDVNGLGTIGTQNNARLYLGTIDATTALIQSRNHITNQSLKFFASSYIFDIGNVGIGASTPSEKLVVNGNVGIVDGNSLHFLPSTNTPWANTKVLNRNWDGQDFIEFLVPGHVANNAKMRMNANGNVGIGTATPGEKLSVNGKIRAHEIKVETANWPDYVFAPDYRMPSLEELEKYINLNKHLPEMPSASDAEKNGIALGEMNKKLLKQQEELVLYLIEKNKEIKDLKRENDTIKSKLDEIILMLNKK